jgi:hypothetical protein
LIRVSRQGRSLEYLVFKIETDLLVVALSQSEALHGRTNGLLVVLHSCLQRLIEFVDGVQMYQSKNSNTHQSFFVVSFTENP